MILIKETLLAAIISELVENVDLSMVEFIAKYEELFQRYVDYTVLKRLLEDSEPIENWAIVQKAKGLALGGRQVERKNHNYPLCCVFSNLSLDESYPEKKYYSQTVLDLGNIMPRSEKDNYNIDDLLRKFYYEFEQLAYSPPGDFGSFLIIIDTLLKKYLWSIPVAGKEDEDISLYDYIKTVTAVVAVLMQEGKKDAPYLLTAGHFSGIQNYIFSVSKVGAGGVAKRLRARSFYVNAMVSALAHCIIHKFGLPMVNILMLTGGKFYILLPNIEDTVMELQKIEQQVTKFLYTKFKGKLSLELVWEKITDDGLCNFGHTVTILSQKLDKKKKRLLESVLIDGKEWSTGKFVVYHDLANKSMCISCRSALVDVGMEMCSNCRTDTEIGGRLPKIEKYSFSRKKGQYKLLDDYYLNLDISAGGDGNYLIMNLNNTSFVNMYNKPVTISFTVNHVPALNTGEVRTFKEIADEAQGSKKLGILKADVDTLGFLFSEGLRKEKNDAVSIARINTLSHMLDLFFGGYVHYLIREKYQNIYCVFSGGDDLFLIGPWSDMPALAIDINERFHEYTGNNPCVTLSAAIYMAESGEHISTMAGCCEKNLDQVKQGADHIINPQKSGRNGIFYLGKVMTWDDFKEQITRGEWVAGFVDKLSVGILRRLAVYSDMYQDYFKNKDIDKLICLPLFSRDLRRFGKTLKTTPDFWIYCEDLYKKASNYKKIDKQFYYMEFCIRYALELTKITRD